MQKRSVMRMRTSTRKLASKNNGSDRPPCSENDSEEREGAPDDNYQLIADPGECGKDPGLLKARIRTRTRTSKRARTRDSSTSRRCCVVCYLHDKIQCHTCFCCYTCKMSSSSNRNVFLCIPEDHEAIDMCITVKPSTLSGRDDSGTNLTIA